MASVSRPVNVQRSDMQTRRRMALAWQEHMLNAHDDWSAREIECILDPKQLKSMHDVTGCQFRI